MQSTTFSTPECLVLQICPDEIAGEITVHGNKYRRTAAYVYLPNIKPGTTFSCPLNYFQESCSLPDKWIMDDSGNKIELTNISNLEKVVVTIKMNGVEEKINVPQYISLKLFDYFKLDIE